MKIQIVNTCMSKHTNCFALIKTGTLKYQCSRHQALTKFVYIVNK